MFCAQCGSALANPQAGCSVCRAGETGSTPAAGAGLTPNTAGVLSYLFLLLSGILFLVIEPYRKDSFVRFHAFQSLFFNIAWLGFWIVWSVACAAAGALAGGLVELLWIPVDLAVALGGMACWIWLMYKAWQGQKYELPYIGRMAARQAAV